MGDLPLLEGVEGLSGRRARSAGGHGLCYIMLLKGGYRKARAFEVKEEASTPQGSSDLGETGEWMQKGKVPISTTGSVVDLHLLVGCWCSATLIRLV